MRNWRFIRKAFLGIAAVSILSLALTGCEEKDGDSSGGGDHPSKSSDHPSQPEKGSGSK